MQELGLPVRARMPFRARVDEVASWDGDALALLHASRSDSTASRHVCKIDDVSWFSSPLDRRVKIVLLPGGVRVLYKVLPIPVVATIIRADDGWELTVEREPASKMITAICLAVLLFDLAMHGYRHVHRILGELPQWGDLPIWLWAGAWLVLWQWSLKKLEPHFNPSAELARIGACLRQVSARTTPSARSTDSDRA